jgi:type I restriction enzyme S subunit
MAGNSSAATRSAEIGDVPSHWFVAPLRTFVSRITYGFTNPMPSTSEGPFMVTAKDIHSGRIDYSTARHTSWEAYRRELTDKSRPRVNDILLTKDGSIGRVAICDRADICINQSVALVQPNDRINPRFLKFLLESPHYQQRMEGDSDGTTIKHIYITRVDKMEVAVPPTDEQRAIAQMLGSLDDKIELNRRMNETLESTARALFQSWFVDFDPVRASTESRPSKLKTLTDLFSNSFQDSALGEIPKGWEVVTVADLANIVGGSTPSTKEPAYWNGSHHWATPKDLSALSVPVLLDTERRVTDLGLTQISSGLLPEGTVLLSSRAPIGYLAVAEVPVAVNQGFIAMKPKKGVSNLFLMLWATFAHEEIVSRANGSTFLEINKTNFRTIPVVRPADTVMEAFDRHIRPLYMRIVENERESRTLVALRDALSPKLMSGEVRVKL